MKKLGKEDISVFVLNASQYLLLMITIPVAITEGFFSIQFGMASPVNIENPKIKMLRDEFISAYCER